MKHLFTSQFFGSIVCTFSCVRISAMYPISMMVQLFFE